MQIELGLTSISHNEVLNILGNELSFDEAQRYLAQDIHIRTFPEVLAAFYDKSDIKQKLIDGLCELDKTVERESVARRVKNWFGGKSAPDSREDLIKICFVLGLSDKMADNFLSLTDEGRFHLRNPRELTFAYCLRMGKSYADADELYQSLKPLEKNADQSSGLVFTKMITESFGHVRDDAAFHTFYNENYNMLGTMHNTAYHKSFIPFLDTLICPNMPWRFEDEPKYTVEEVVNEYLRMNIPLDKKTAKLSTLQKTIRRYWPNATTVTRMRNREIDVSRKMLMLLYLVTGGSVEANDSALYAETPDEASAAEQFENHFWSINAMLYDAGMSRIDPRNAFDWLVLYCLKTDADEAMDERLQGLLNKIFETETS